MGHDSLLQIGCYCFKKQLIGGASQLAKRLVTIVEPRLENERLLISVHRLLGYVTRLNASYVPLTNPICNEGIPDPLRERWQPERITTVLDPEHTKEKAVHEEDHAPPYYNCKLLRPRIRDAWNFQC